MNFNIQAKSFELTDSIRDHFETAIQRLHKIVDIDDPSVIIFTEVSKTKGDQSGKDLYRAEINIDISGKKFFSKEEMSDIYPAIDKVCDEIFLMIRDDKNKKLYDRKKSGLKIKRMLKRIGF